MRRVGQGPFRLALKIYFVTHQMRVKLEYWSFIFSKLEMDVHMICYFYLFIDLI